MAIAISRRKKRFKLESLITGARHYNIASAALGLTSRVAQLAVSPCHCHRDIGSRFAVPARTTHPRSSIENINVRAIFHFRFSLYYYFVPAGR